MARTTARKAMGRRSQGITWATMAGILLMESTAVSQHVYTDSFPTNDEYDPNILDPNTIFGSPYGGFSRATRSRLAALPLRLPALPDSEPLVRDENYYEVRDGLGRRYACRVYHEDELEAISLSDSMFDTAVEKIQKSTDGDKPADGEDQTTSTEKETSSAQQEHSGTTMETNEANTEQGRPKESGDPNINGDDGETMDSSDEDMESDTGLKRALSAAEQLMGIEHNVVEKIVELEHLMTKLDGVCAQIHKGWWSYEWCHGTKVSQFHIHVTNSDKLKASSIEVQDVTKLGEFVERRIEVFDDPEKEVDGMRMIGQVVDVFQNGDICPDTGKPRHVQVQLRCCTKKQMKLTKGGILYNGKQVSSNIASILSFKEGEVCSYSATVCTPLLCEGAADAFGDKNFGLEIEKPTRPKHRKTPPRKENESIRETLDRVLSSTCLVSGTGGWWVYEFCHGRHIRQFHEATVMDAITGMSSKIVETQHILGLYPAEELESFPNTEEANHVVNVTDGVGGNHAREKRGSKGKIGGNVAFFVQEYKNGDVCDHSDVTDAAIKAGNVGTGGIERSTTVRFSCGPKLDFVQVNEDSTCHYVIDVTIPDLCHHPLFKAPVPKTQVVKCLPVDDPNPQVT